jgi:hypothetical protein
MKLNRFVAASLGLWPLAGHSTDYMAKARNALQKLDLKTAQIELRNAVRADPQNARARFLLARVQLQLGDPVAAEEQARQAQVRGYDPVLTTPLIGVAPAQGRAIGSAGGPGPDQSAGPGWRRTVGHGRRDHCHR